MLTLLNHSNLFSCTLDDCARAPTALGTHLASPPLQNAGKRELQRLEVQQGIELFKEAFIKHRVDHHGRKKVPGGLDYFKG